MKKRSAAYLIGALVMIVSVMSLLSVSAFAVQEATPDYILMLDSQTGKAYKTYDPDDYYDDRVPEKELPLNTGALKGLTYEDGKWVMNNFHFTTTNPIAIHRLYDTVIELKGENSVTPGKVAGTSSMGFYVLPGNYAQHSYDVEFQGEGKFTVAIGKTQEAGGSAFYNGGGDITVGEGVELVLSHEVMTPNSAGSVSSSAINCNILTNYGKITATSAEMKLESDDVYFQQSSGSVAVRCWNLYNYGEITATSGKAMGGYAQLSSSGLSVDAELVNEGTITAAAGDAWYCSAGAKAGTVTNRGTMTLTGAKSPSNYSYGLQLDSYWDLSVRKWVHELDVVNESGTLTIKSGEAMLSYGIGTTSSNQYSHVYVYGGEVYVTGWKRALEWLEDDSNAVIKGGAEYNGKAASAVAWKDRNYYIGSAEAPAKTLKFGPGPKEIKKITITDVKVPVVGENSLSDEYAVAKTLLGEDRYSIYRVSWYDEDGKRFIKNFEEGKPYKARVNLLLEEGFSLTKDGLTATINGYPAEYEGVSTWTNGDVTHTFCLFFNEKLAAPANVTVSYGEDGPVISWDAVDKAVKYQVWRKTGADGTYEKIFTQSATSYTDTDAVEGTTYYYKITATDPDGFYTTSDDSAEITVDWKLPAPGNLKITMVAASGKPKLTWNAVEGADKYEVFRKTGKTGTYSKLYTTKQTTFTNANAVPGKTYYYKVRAIDADNSAANSAFGAEKYCTCDLAKPTNLKLTCAADSGKPKVTWDAVEGAFKYEVYRKTGKDGTYSKLYTTKQTTFTNANAVPGKTYYYKVRALLEDNSYATSAYSAEANIVCDLAKPTNVKLTCAADSGKPKLTWDAVDGAEKYEVYRKTGKTGTYSKLYTTKQTTFTNANAVPGKTYYYKVRAIDADSSAATSAYSVEKYVVCDLAKPTNVKLTCAADSGKPKLTWDAVDGAEKYEVYRKTGKTGTYSKLYTTTQTTFTNANAVAGKTYYYKVRAIDADSSAATSAYSAEKYIVCDLAKPTNLTISLDGGKPKLTWDAVAGADRYEVWRKTGADGTFGKQYTTTKTTFTNANAVAGTTYYYKVRAIDDDSSAAASAYSAIRNIKSK